MRFSEHHHNCGLHNSARRLYQPSASSYAKRRNIQPYAPASSSSIRALAQAPGYERYRLSNGLQLILVNPSLHAPGFALRLAFKAGAADDPIGLDGTAHFKEHMVFGETDVLARGEFNRLVERFGIYSNAGTSKQGTSYELNCLAGTDDDEAMRLIANFFKQARCSPEHVAIERGIIEAELAKYNNLPSEQLSDAIHALVFADTAFARTILGTQESLARIDETALAAFTRTYYQPAQAALVVTGNYDKQRLLNAAARNLPGLLNNSQKIPPRIRTNSTGDLRELNIKQNLDLINRMAIAYKLPRFNARELLMLDLLAEVLSSAEGSLHHSLMDSGVSSDYEVEPALFTKDQGALIIHQVLEPEADFTKAVATTRSILENMATQFNSQAVFEQARKRLIRTLIRQRNHHQDHADAVVYALQSGLSSTLSPAKTIKTLGEIKPSEFNDFCKKVFRNPYIVCQHADPVTAAPEPELVRLPEAELAAELPKVDFKLKLPEFRLKFDDTKSDKSNLRASHYYMADSNMLSLEAKISPAFSLSPKDQLSLRLLAYLMQLGYKHDGQIRTEAEMLSEFGNLDADYSLDYESDDLSLNLCLEIIATPRARLEQRLQGNMTVLAKQLSGPIFSEANLKRAKQELKAVLRASSVDSADQASSIHANKFLPQRIAAKQMLDLLPDHKLTDLEDFYNRLLKSSQITVATAGDLPKLSAAVMAPAFAGFSGQQAAREDEISLVKSNPQVELKRKRNAEVDVISFANAHAVNINHPDYEAMDLAIRFLCGSSTDSYIGRVIREQFGLTYTVSGNLAPYANGSICEFRIQVKPEHSKPVLVLINRILERLANQGMNQSELDAIKMTAVSELLSTEYISPETASGSMLDEMDNSKSPNDIKQWVKTINELSLERVNIALKQLIAAGFNTVVVGRGIGF